jgi:hypothetical protein
MKSLALLSILIVILGLLLTAVSVCIFSFGVKLGDLLGDQNVKYTPIGLGAFGLVITGYGIFLLRKAQQNH